MCKVRDKLPTWVNEKHDLVLSNDLDSLASCSVMRENTGSEIKYFYDFEKLYGMNDATLEKCWIDVAIQSGHSFDNHVSRISRWEKWNPDMINLNMMYRVTNENYSDKFAGSTLLTIMSAYNMPLPESEEGKMILLSIDGTFIGFYSEFFNRIQKRYLDEVLCYPELYEVMERHVDTEFYDIRDKYNLEAPIYFKDGKIETEMDLEKIGELLGLDLDIIPNKELKVINEYQIIQTDFDEKRRFETKDIDSDIETFAITYKNKVRYSKLLSA